MSLERDFTVSRGSSQHTAEDSDFNLSTTASTLDLAHFASPLCSSDNNRKNNHHNIDDEEENKANYSPTRAASRESETQFRSELNDLMSQLDVFGRSLEEACASSPLVQTISSPYHTAAYAPAAAAAITVGRNGDDDDANNNNNSKIVNDLYADDTDDDDQDDGIAPLEIFAKNNINDYDDDDDDDDDVDAEETRASSRDALPSMMKQPNLVEVAVRRIATANMMRRITTGNRLLNSGTDLLVEDDADLKNRITGSARGNKPTTATMAAKCDVDEGEKAPSSSSDPVLNAAREEEEVEPAITITREATTMATKENHRNDVASHKNSINNNNNNNNNNDGYTTVIVSDNDGDDAFPNETGGLHLSAPFVRSFSVLDLGSEHVSQQESFLLSESHTRDVLAARAECTFDVLFDVFAVDTEEKRQQQRQRQQQQQEEEEQTTNEEQEEFSPWPYTSTSYTVILLQEQARTLFFHEEERCRDHIIESEIAEGSLIFDSLEYSTQLLLSIMLLKRKDAIIATAVVDKSEATSHSNENRLRKKLGHAKMLSEQMSNDHDEQEEQSRPSTVAAVTAATARASPSTFDSVLLLKGNRCFGGQRSTPDLVSAAHLANAIPFPPPSSARVTASTSSAHQKKWKF